MKFKIKDLCSEVLTGGTPKTTVAEYYNGTIPWLNTKEINFKTIYTTEKTITNEGLNNSAAKWVPVNSVIIAMYGATAGKVAVNSIPLTTNQACCNLVINPKLADYRYIYHYIKYQYKYISSLANGGAQQNLNTDIIKNLELELPKLIIQSKIADILHCFDKKIELNNSINDNLEEQMETLYRNMISSIGPDHKSVTVDKFCNIFTGKKNANQFDENGSYMFFTCGEKSLKINSYIYDGPAVIISGNGSYTGRTMFYNGKFDLYQRTYACTLKPEYPPEYIFALYAILKFALHKKISGGTHGSSIPYIVMDDIAKFEFNIKHDEFIIFAQQSKVILDAIQHNNNENSNLAKLRDSMLPKLMSGDIDVSDL